MMYLYDMCYFCCALSPTELEREEGGSAGQRPPVGATIRQRCGLGYRVVRVDPDCIAYAKHGRAALANESSWCMFAKRLSTACAGGRHYRKQHRTWYVGDFWPEKSARVSGFVYF